MCSRLTNHCFQPNLPVTRVVVPLPCRKSIIIISRSSLRSIQPFLQECLINLFKEIFFSMPLFYLPLFISIRLAWAPKIIFKILSCTHSCLSHNSLISPCISIKFASVLLLCMLYQWKKFQLKTNTSLYLRDSFTLQIDSVNDLDPFKWFKYQYAK